MNFILPQNKKILIEEIDRLFPELKNRIQFNREGLIEYPTSILSMIAEWLNDLAKESEKNHSLIKRICKFINDIDANHLDYLKDDIKNDIQVSFFWALKYTTILYIKEYLNHNVLTAGRNYLKKIERDNYQEF